MQHLRRKEKQIIVWSIVHIREPVEYTGWTSSFEWDTELRDFRRKFTSYASISKRIDVEEDDMAIMLGRLEQEERERRYGLDDDDDLEDIPGCDLRLFACFSHYCRDDSEEHEPWTYRITKETFRASQDPLHSVKKPGAWSHIRSWVGDKNHYEVDEYCLRIDLFLTMRDRITRVRAVPLSPLVVHKSPKIGRIQPTHTRVMSAFMSPSMGKEGDVAGSASTAIAPPTPSGPPGSPVRDKKGTNAGSSEGDAIIVTSSDSEEPLETHYAKEREEERSASQRSGSLTGHLRTSSTSTSLKSRQERVETSSTDAKKKKQQVPVQKKDKGKGKEKKR